MPNNERKVKVYTKEKKPDWRSLLNSTPDDNPWVGVVAIVASLVFIGGTWLVLRMGSDAPIAKTYEREVSADTYPGVYPVAIPSGTLVCGYGIPGQSNDGSFKAVWFRAPDGTMYPLNGTADGANAQYSLGHPDLEAIWLDNPQNPALKKSLEDFIRDGLALCE